MVHHRPKEMFFFVVCAELFMSRATKVVAQMISVFFLSNSWGVVWDPKKQRGQGFQKDNNRRGAQQSVSSPDSVREFGAQGRHVLMT